MNNLSSYCGLTYSRVSASDTDLTLNTYYYLNRSETSLNQMAYTNDFFVSDRKRLGWSFKIKFSIVENISCLQVRANLLGYPRLSLIRKKGYP